MIKTVVCAILCAAGCVWDTDMGPEQVPIVNVADQVLLEVHHDDSFLQESPSTQQVDQASQVQDEQPQSVQPEPKAYFVCVGMERSERFGECSGCEIDALRMSKMFKDKYGYDGVTLISEKATRESVHNALSDAIGKCGENDLVLFCYSGHGGQERITSIEPDDADVPDEFLCLYDTYMLDDEIWDLVSKCRGRIFLYFDACHSATMYRSVCSSSRRSAGAEQKGKEKMEKTKGFTFRIRGSAMSALVGGGRIRMMCWSGCEEKEYSYGSDSGGLMTRATMSKWSKDKTYAKLWDEVRNAVMSAEPTQHPVCTIIGGGFDKEVFK